ncbi:MAG: phosphoribosylaminoimidazolesuccinocarboxamide synthase [Bacteroidetes bacterium]|nr:phosphoribosylaminoimidazolesuccinocarboxamide synthase [Bacteroidota bacterium]MDA1333026.1 phosphoribosylaminoimidazolesuccinocarboxamide synthase [Bacteroidota bacterium]
MESAVAAQMGATVRDTHFDFLGTRYGGKVRDTYQVGDRLVLVTSDRISAFDHILRQTIPFKGQVLNQLAAWFFSQTQDIVTNHVLLLPDPNVTIAKRCNAIPVEFVVRGYVAGHAWRTYRDGGRTLCGHTLPEGLRQNSKLPSPILTPATKAEEGHDEDISREGILNRGLLSKDHLDQLEALALALFQRGTDRAAARDLILVDTKYEFGFDNDGGIVLIDEIHTPDSSRYFYADTYHELLQADKPQRQLSKEFVREWLMNNGFQGLEGQVLPDMPNDFRAMVSFRYIELFEQITGTSFVPDTSSDPIARIETNIRKALSGFG